MCEIIQFHLTEAEQQISVTNRYLTDRNLSSVRYWVYCYAGLFYVFWVFTLVAVYWNEIWIIIWKVSCFVDHLPKLFRIELESHSAWKHPTRWVFGGNQMYIKLCLLIRYFYDFEPWCLVITVNDWCVIIDLFTLCGNEEQH